jgi:hypothetical protein
MLDVTFFTQYAESIGYFALLAIVSPLIITGLIKLAITLLSNR